MVRCEVCFRHCSLSEGQTGFCLARRCEGDKTVPVIYGRATALALDPIEKKPLYHFYSGGMIVSFGGYGCNLACPFCQNADISLSERHGPESPDIQAGPFPKTEEYTPQELTAICESYRDHGNIGIAFTYNEPTIGYEYIIDVAKLIHERDMQVVLVTNGSASEEILDKLLPHLDAMNIDLKSFDESYYKNVLKGDLPATKRFIEKAVEHCHVEVTTLIVPRPAVGGPVDGSISPDTLNWDVWEEEMGQIAEWLSDIGTRAGKDIPLHVTRFFPRSRYKNLKPTPVQTLFHLGDIAREHLKFVYEGNV